MVPLTAGGQSDTGRLVYDTLLPWLPDMAGTVEGLLLRGTVGEGLSLPHLTLLTSSLSSLHTFTSLYGFSWSGDISPAHMMSTALRNLHSALSSNDQARKNATHFWQTKRAVRHFSCVLRFVLKSMLLYTVWVLCATVYCILVHVYRSWS